MNTPKIKIANLEKENALLRDALIKILWLAEAPQIVIQSDINDIAKKALGFNEQRNPNFKRTKKMLEKYSNDDGAIGALAESVLTIMSVQ